MNVLAEFNDSDYNSLYSSPWLPWCMSGIRPFWGGTYGWRTGRSLWSIDTRSNYELKSEYVYGNGIVSRNDWTSGYRYSCRTGIEYYHTDMLGSVMMTSNEAGLMTNRYHYDVFGNNYTGSLAGSNALGYGGKRYDAATAFYDYGFRDYDSRTGRFTTQDPIRDGVNWYVYCNNDPVNFFDLWGLKPAQDKASAIAFSSNAFALSSPAPVTPTIDNFDYLDTDKWLNSNNLYAELESDVRPCGYYYDNKGQPSTNPNVVDGRNIGEVCIIPANKNDEDIIIDAVNKAIKNHSNDKYITPTELNNYKGYQCDNYVFDVINEAGGNAMNHLHGLPCGTNVDDSIEKSRGNKDLIHMEKNNATTLDRGAYSVLMNNSSVGHISHSAVVVKDNDKISISQNASFAGGAITETYDSEQELLKAYGYNDFYFQKITR